MVWIIKRNELNKQQECQKVIACLKQNISDLANEKEFADRTIKELASKVRNTRFCLLH